MLRREFVGGIPLTGLAGALVRGSPEELSSAGMFDVIRHGAKGDGRTDDSDAIQRALDAAHRAPGGGTVYFPGGTFLVRRTIAIRGNGVRLLGLGSSVTRIRASRGLEALVAVGTGERGLFGWGLEGFRLEGGGAAVSRGIWFRGAREGRLLDVWVVECGTEAAVHFDGGGQGGCWSNRCDGLWATRAPGTGLLISGAANALHFQGGGFTVAGRSNVVVRSAKGVWFAACQFEGARGGPDLLVLAEADAAVIGVAVAQSWFEVRRGDARARNIVVAAGEGVVRGMVVRDSYFAGNNSADAAVECEDDGAELSVLQNAFTGFRRAGVLSSPSAAGVRVDGFGASAWYGTRSALPLQVKE